MTKHTAIIATAIAAVTCIGGRSMAEEKKRDFTSKVPFYTFPDILAEQEAALKTNPLLLRMIASREAKKDDPHRPIYHYVNPEARLNDPNGLCYWQGKWHLFYQAYPPEDTRQHWGHAISEDLVHWRDLPYAIYPNPEDKCFSGSALAEDDRVIAIYHGIAVGTMVATSDDPLLLNWDKVSGGAVIPFAKPGEPEQPYTIFDPCIWKQGDHYYAMTAGTLPDGPDGKNVRAEFLHRSKDLATWEYLHPFLENDQYGMIGDDGACPYFWPIGDKHILLHFSHMSGGKYLLGDYDTERQKFVVTDAGDFNHGPVAPGGTHAPSAAPDGKGGVNVLFNMNPAKPTEGWNQIMTLPRLLTLDEDGRLLVEPVAALESLRREKVSVGKMKVEPNQDIVLDGVEGNAMEIVAEIRPGASQMIEMRVLRSPGSEEYTRILFYKNRGYKNHDRKRGRGVSIASWLVIDNSYSSTAPDVGSRAPEEAPILIDKNENLKLRVFIDKSVVEVYANGKQCAAVRVYPEREDSLGVSLRSQGQPCDLISLDAFQMENIYK